VLTLTRSIKFSPGGAELLLIWINKSRGTTKSYLIKRSFIVVSVTTSHRSLRSL
jgi:L-ascorbate metabolism protein UlaG (beta-lactamase superfamily)